MAIRKFTKADKKLRLNELFTVGDLYLNDDLDYILLDEQLVVLITKCAEHFGKRPVFPTKNSLFRTAATNKACGGARGSKHKLGIAADFSFEGVSRVELARYAETLLPASGGIGVYGGKNEHIHLDTRPNKQRWWIKTSGSNTPGFGGIAVAFKHGSRSPAVTDIQHFLNAHGFDCGKADGVFGISTVNALKAYQQSAGIKADGVYGKATNNATGLFDWR